MGPALFFSLIIIVVSFLPVFLLEAQEGRMFRPLAWTKTLALVFSSLLSITLVPALMLVVHARQTAARESQNPVVAHHARRSICRCCAVPASLEDRRLLLNLVFLAVTIPLCFRLGSQFMPRFIRRFRALHAYCAARHLHHAGRRS